MNGVDVGREVGAVVRSVEGGVEEGAR